MKRCVACVVQEKDLIKVRIDEVFFCKRDRAQFGFSAIKCKGKGVLC